MGEVRALLLTDVVDSTRLSEALGDEAMAALWAAHDRVARDLLPVHHGREIDKTDGFLMLFTEATDAVAYAVAYHRALRRLDPPIQARAGLHVGSVILTENHPDDVARGAKPLEVDGIAKPTAARVMSIARGGQTLLTPSAREALGPTELRVCSHGHWRMKGVAEPVELFEVGDDDAPFTPPPDGGKVYRVVQQGALWIPAAEVPRALPGERDAFVGRQGDLRALADRVERSRLVSVLGIGGTGKTRLVTRFGWTWLGDYPGGVWFCDLSEARSLEGVASATARALDLPLAQGDPLRQVGRAIQGRGRCLVILDNFEQVAHLADASVGSWLDLAPDARFVVTSREVLGLSGETTLALAPLDRAEGLALFVERAAQSKRGFALTEADRPHVEALVDLLDGLPLAIELAAARVRVLPPAKLLARMSDRFRLLASKGTRPERQATLRATLDWSWDLLDPDEQAALAQLSVFEGGFTLEDAEAVLALEEAWPMDAVQALVDRSLVREVDDGAFDLLVSVQEYAAERLRERGEVGETRARHWEHFSERGTAEALEALVGPEALRGLLSAFDNLVAACRRATEAGATAEAARLVRVLWEAVSVRGPYPLVATLAAQVEELAEGTPRDLLEMRRLRAAALSVTGRSREAEALLAESLELLAALPEPDPQTRCTLVHERSLALQRLGRPREALQASEEALALAESLASPARVAACFLLQGIVLGQLGEVDASERRYLQTLQLHRERGDLQREAVVLVNLADLLLRSGRPEEARRHAKQGLVHVRALGDRRTEANLLANLGAIHGTMGHPQEALEAFEAARTAHLEVGARSSLPLTECNIGFALMDLGRIDAAEEAGRHALAMAIEEDEPHAQFHARGLLAAIRSQHGDPEGAVEHLLAKQQLAEAAGWVRLQAVALVDLGVLQLQLGRLDEARASLEAGQALSAQVKARVNNGFAHAALAELAFRQGQPEAAREALAAAEREAEGMDPSSGLVERITEVRAGFARQIRDLEG